MSGPYCKGKKNLTSERQNAPRLQYTVSNRSTDGTELAHSEPKITTGAGVRDPGGEVDIV